MFDLGFLIFTGFVAALVGLLVGISLQRSVGGNASKVRELNKALDEAKEHNQTYQSHVAEHFSQTAVMLNDLTEKYKDIHHLILPSYYICSPFIFSRYNPIVNVRSMSFWVVLLRC